MPSNLSSSGSQLSVLFWISERQRLNTEGLYQGKHLCKRKPEGRLADGLADLSNQHPDLIQNVESGEGRRGTNHPDLTLHLRTAIRILPLKQSQQRMSPGLGLSWYLPTLQNLVNDYEEPATVLTSAQTWRWIAMWALCQRCHRTVSELLKELSLHLPVPAPPPGHRRQQVSLTACCLEDLAMQPELGGHVSCVSYVLATVNGFRPEETETELLSWYFLYQ